MIPTQEEDIALQKVGAALKTRRRLMGLRAGSVAAAAGVSESVWRNAEGGKAGTKLAFLLHALRLLRVDIGLLVQLVERAILRDLDPGAVQQINLTREKPGRPRKENALEQ